MITPFVLTALIHLAAPPEIPPTTSREDASVRDRLGTAIPRDVELVDHEGHRVALGSLLDGRRPLVIVPAYYRCPMLCGLTIASVAEALAELPLVPGEDFEIATISFDPRDGPADAERARARAIELYGSAVGEEAWPFFAGAPVHVERLMDAIGFGFVYDKPTDQYAHSSAVFVVSPAGELVRVLPGVQIAAVDLRLALVEAGRGEVGSFAEQALLTCFRYDPVTRRYGFWVLGFLRLAGGVLVTLFGTGYVLLLLRDRRRTRSFADDPQVQR